MSFHIDDIHGLERAPASPGALRAKLSDLILDSTNCRANVELVNPATGEYRVVLQGVLDREAASWEPSSR